MKTWQRALLCVGAAQLILTDPAPGEYVGIQIFGVGNPYGLVVWRVYAVFDRPGEDEMLAVYGTPEVPLTLTAPGCLYQHPFGSDTAPHEALIAAFPSLAFDTFVTIGVKSVGPPDGQPVDDITLLPGWPGLDPCPVTTTTSGWAVPPGSPQGDPFDQVNSFPGNGRVLIGQFSSAKSLVVDGTMLIQYRSNGVIEDREIAFRADFPRCVAESDCIDHPCFGTAACAHEGELCFNESSPSPDCNNNYILDSCDIGFGTSADINSNGVPDDCECVGDCGDGDGIVGITDFLALLGVWGQTDVACDIDGGGVGINDFLLLLSLWGPCP